MALPLDSLTYAEMAGAHPVGSRGLREHRRVREELGEVPRPDVSELAHLFSAAETVGDDRGRWVAADRRQQHALGKSHR